MARAQAVSAAAPGAGKDEFTVGYYTSLPYTILIIEDARGPQIIYQAEYPELPAVPVGQGATPWVAARSLQSRLQGWVTQQLARGDPVPVPGQGRPQQQLKWKLNAQGQRVPTDKFQVEDG